MNTSEISLPRKDAVAIDVVIPEDGVIKHLFGVPRRGIYQNLPVLPYKKVEENEDPLLATKLLITQRIGIEEGIDITSVIGTNYAVRPITHPEGARQTYMSVFEGNVNSRRMKSIINHLLNTTDNAFFSRFEIISDVHEPFNLAEERGSICSGITRYHINHAQRNHIRPLLPTLLKTVEKTPLERFPIQDDLLLQEIEEMHREGKYRRHRFLEDMNKEEVLNFRRLNPKEREHSNYGFAEDFERMFIIRSGQTGRVTLWPPYGDDHETDVEKIVDSMLLSEQNRTIISFSHLQKPLIIWNREDESIRFEATGESPLYYAFMRLKTH